MIDIWAYIFLSVIKAFISVILVASGTAKLADITSFKNTLVNLEIRILPFKLVQILALLIPISEFILGVLFIANFFEVLVSWTILSLFILFSLITVLAIIKKPNVTCRCFGALSDTQFNVKGLLRCLLFLCLTFMIIFSMPFYHAQPPKSPILLVLVIFGFLILGFAFFQTAKTMANYKERLRS